VIYTISALLRRRRARLDLKGSVATARDPTDWGSTPNFIASRATAASNARRV
jgi:hypothetical protein